MSAAPDIRPDMPVTAVGTNGQITVDGQQVRIRKGLVTRRHGVRGERQVSLANIAAVHVQPATEHGQGSLQLLLKSEEVASDERIVRFAASSAEQFDAVRNRLEALLPAPARS